MATRSSIEWTEATWNPVTGCTRVSPGCDNCYAVGMSRRLAAMGQAKYEGLINPGKEHFNGVVKLHEAALEIPLKRKKPTMYFVNSMSDLFHKDVPDQFINGVFAVMAMCPQHTFQVLTKRPKRAALYMAAVQAEIDSDDADGSISFIRSKIAHAFRYVSKELCGDPFWMNAPLLLWDNSDAPAECERTPGWPLPNVWLGTSVEDQKAANARIPHLLRCPAHVRFLSCEPLLGPVRLDQIPTGDRGVTVNALTGVPYDWDYEQYMPDDADVGRTINWIIAGGESGTKARPMHPDWARLLRDQCRAAGVPFFFKQWGRFIPEDQIWLNHNSPGPTGYRYWGAKTIAMKIDTMGGMEHLFNTGRLHQFEDSTFAIPVGKKVAGRMLDRREWNEYPERTEVAV